MADAFGSLISAGASIFGAEVGAHEQTALANQAIAQQQWMDTHHIQDVVSDAKAAGINPLAALGVSTPSSPVSVGETPQVGPGVTQAGQDIGRAVNAMATKDDKTEALNQQLLQAKIDNTNADTVSIMSRSSSQARTMGQPGTPPSFPPLPTADPRYEGGIEPAAQRFRMPDGSIAIEPSQKFTQSTFSTSPFGKLRAGGIEASDIPGLPAIRPDVLRNIGTPSPDSYNTP